MSESMKQMMMSRDGNTPLIIESFFGDTPEVERLIQEHPRDVNKGNKDGITPIIMAANAGHCPEIELLINAGADINKHSKNGITPLLMAIYNNHLPAIELLIRHGVDVNKKGDNGETPLMFLVSRPNNIEKIKLLLEGGANIDERDSQGRSAFDLAANDQIRELLKEYDKRNKRNKTILTRKIYNTYGENGGLGLFDNGLDVNSERDLYEFMGGRKGKKKSIKKRRSIKKGRSIKKRKPRKSIRRRRL